MVRLLGELETSECGMNVYIFGDSQAEGRAEMKNLLGGKGANLAEMTNTGLPVTPGMDTINVSGLFRYNKFFHMNY